MFGHTARMSFIVWSTPDEGRVDEFNRWYDEVHLPDAIANGSFTAMHRYELAGPGHRGARSLSIAEADYGSEAEAWASVQPKAQALRDAGRIDDLYRVEIAVMLHTVRAEVSVHPVQTLTTVQNDWREPGGDPDTWFAGLALPALGTHSRQLFTTEAEGRRGAGLHLALFETDLALDDAVAAWAHVGAAGAPPMPAYTTLFGVTAPPRPDDPPVAPTWVAHWRHRVTVGR